MQHFLCNIPLSSIPSTLLNQYYYRPTPDSLKCRFEKLYFHFLLTYTWPVLLHEEHESACKNTALSPKAPFSTFGDQPLIQVNQENGQRRLCTEEIIHLFLHYPLQRTISCHAWAESVLQAETWTYFTWRC